MKQIIKSRILADCWKKHPTHGTIPIEIYVMSALSSSTYVLPQRRPWDPLRFAPPPSEPLPAPANSSETTAGLGKADGVTEEGEDRWQWREGATHKGHPSIIPMLEFFEDAHYYYVILPATVPSFPPPPFPPISLNSSSSFDAPLTMGSLEGKFPSDLFDLVEKFPTGLPAPLIRSYLGQLADALAFLHARGICHRDIKDENVVLGEEGRCWLIDFGSSGVVKKGGWDSFSGT